VTGRANIERFLATDPRDVGCEEAMEILHVYAEAATSGRKPEELYPGVAAHLRACGPCAEDLHGLLSALEEDR
jgi:hypothetical protein